MQEPLVEEGRKITTSKSMQRPRGFKEREDALKNLMANQNENYFEWLDEQHKKMLLAYTVKQFT